MDSYAGFTGYVCTEAAYGKKKLRIKKYPDMCELGLKLTLILCNVSGTKYTDFLKFENIANLCDLKANHVGVSAC